MRPKHSDPKDFSSLKRKIDRASFPSCRGQVTGVDELSIEGFLPGARIGSRAVVESPDGRAVPAEVAAFRGEQVKLLPLMGTAGIGPGDSIVLGNDTDEIEVGEGLLGRVIDVMGSVLDGGPPIQGGEPWAVDRKSPDPLTRKKVDEPLVTGVRAIDGCLTMGQGQRMGLFAGPGAGKSTLLGTLARNTDADVSVICLVGERGREVREFIDDKLGPEGLKKSVLILATADSPPLIRARAIHVATAVAEWFRGRGRRVLLLLDSLTRVVRARRDMALALGESPARGGFPSSSFAPLPGLLERAGSDDSGSISAVFTVLTEGRGDDVVAEESRSLLDGHIVLSSKLAGAGRWPAIDIVRSVSRVMDSVAPEAVESAARLRRLISAYEENEDLILMGAYRRGTSTDTDMALDRKDQVEAFLRQDRNTISTLECTRLALDRLVRGQV